MGRFARGVARVGVLLVMAGRAGAHHEAIFGPQAGLFLSTPRYVGLMHFEIYRGEAGLEGAERVTPVSVGLPVGYGFSLAAIGALTNKSDPSGKVTRGFEQPVLGGRYIRSLGRRTGLLGMAAVEFPAGQIDPPSWNGLGGAQLSSEGAGRWSGIGYAYGKVNGPDRSGARAGHNLFLGAGLAYRIGGEEEGRWLLSPQMGLSLEFTGNDLDGTGTAVPSGGRALVAHPTVVFAPPSERWSGFVVVSMPAAQSWEVAMDRHRYRLGAGIILFL